jgi:predicted DNA-binding helix-hairpin-helix protein
MNRVYFSAYQKALGDASLSAQQGGTDGSDAVFMREHRLYQVDFLMRKYGFRDADVPFDAQGNLSLETDPKEGWALSHPEYFPLDVNRASRLELLRVPGLGPITVSRILRVRRTQRIGSLQEIGAVGARLGKARQYLTF